MPKFDISNSQFAKMWNGGEGRAIVEAIIDNPDLIRANHMFWAEKFRIDPQITPTNQEGAAVFISKMREMQNGELMSVRAPLGDSVPEDRKGVKYYSGVIPELISRGTVETAVEREYKRQLFDQFGDAALIAAYATDVLQSKLDGANQTLSHFAAQLLSTGKIVYKQGYSAESNIIKAEIPVENFITAGAEIWTNTDAKLLDQIRKIYTDAKERFGLDMAMQLEVPRALFNEAFLKNKQVIEWVRYVGTINNTPLPETAVMTEDMVMNAVVKFEGLPKIVIVEEKQNDVLNGTVHGWAEGIAVLRPVGYAGYMRHTNIADTRLLSPEYTNPANTYSFASALNGLAVVRNSVIVNGNFKEWHTDLVLAAVPSLDEFLYHIIIDTTEADA